MRITNIDSKSIRVKVAQGKGAKDRYTILSRTVLLELRAYYVQYMPIEYLFNGSGKSRRYSTRTIQKVVQNAIIKALLENKDYYVRTITHTLATQLVDNGTDLHTVPGGTTWYNRCAAYLVTTTELSPTRTLHCKWWRDHKGCSVERSNKK